MDLTRRSFLRELDFTGEELSHLLTLAAELKSAKRAGTEQPRLLGRHLAALFERSSTRTRSAFEVAAHDQGAHATFLDAATTHLGREESAPDTARVLGRYYDGILYRGDSDETLRALAEHAGVPVWNGLTRDWHPTQMLADVLTMLEHTGRPVEEISFAFLGDATGNIGRSCLAVGAVLGMDVRIVAPKALWPDETGVVTPARESAARSEARITLTDELAAGVEGVDFVTTDVWTSMGSPWSLWEERIELLLPYQVNAKLMAMTGNPGTALLHCLPAFHDLGTEVVREVHARTGLTELEVTDQVFSSPASLVFDQAENRMHTIKALILATLAGA